MGFRRTKNPTADNLWAMTDLADASDIPENELRSFRRANLIMEATKVADGETCYIVVETSFTVSDRNIARAIRHTGFLTRFTGKDAYAAVVGYT